MAIACAYCSGEHDSPAEIRTCWLEGGQQDVALGDESPIPVGGHESFDDQLSEPAGGRSSQRSSERAPQRMSQPKRSSTPSAPVRQSAVVRGAAVATAGPDTLGRHCVVDAGASAPETWATAERVVIDAAVLAEPEQALIALRAAHHERRRLVIDLATDFEREPRLKTEAEPFEVGATFAFEREELHHLVWSNSVDVRDE